MSTETRNLYQRWIGELWNGELGRLDTAAGQLVSANFVGHWPGRPALVRGATALAEVVRQGRLPFSPLRFRIEVGPIVDGDLVSARWIATGVYAGGEHPLPGATAPPGTPVEFNGHDILRVAGGVFVEYWVVSAVEHLMAQLAGDQG